MTRRRVITFVVLCVLSFAQMPAQNAGTFAEYHILTVQNSLPLNFLEDSQQRFERTAKSVSTDQVRSERKNEVNFYELNGYFSEMVRFSGKVLVDDTLTRMLNGVADKLLVDAPKLRSSISIYSLRSPSVNAFATPDGMIFVNLGLVARLESEDELAFVLSHEIAHIFKQHSLKGYLSKYKMDGDPGDYRVGDKSWEVHNYSQFSEFQADSLGFDLFKKAGYDPWAASTALDKLRYAEYPLLEGKLDLSEWESKYLFIPSAVKNKVYPANVPDDGVAEGSTHPATNERILLVNELLGSGVREKKSQSDWFFRKLALFECASLYNDELESFAGIYHCASLLKEYPDNSYLQSELARALYGAVLTRNRLEMNEVWLSGEAMRVGDLFYELSKDQAASMALRIVWDLHLSNPEDKDIMYYAYGIMCELSAVSKMKASSFERDGSVFKREMEKFDSSSALYGDSIARMWTNQNAGSKHVNVYRFSFCGMASDSIFEFLFSKAKADYRDFTGMLEVQNYLIGNRPEEGVAAISPFSFYSNISRKSEEAINFKMMSRIRKDITASIVQSARRLKIPATVMNPALTKETNPNGYNALAILNDWLTCKIALDSTIAVLPFPVTRISQLESMTSCVGVVNSGYLQVQEGRDYEPYHFFSVLGAVMVPNIVWTMMKPRMAGIFFYQQYDLRTGDLNYEYVAEMSRQVYRSSMMSTHIYYALRKSTK